MNARSKAFLRPLVVTLLALAAASTREAFAQGASQLTTTPSRPFVTAAGVSFDLSATTPLTIYRVGIATAGRSGVASSLETIEVWKRAGGCGASPGTQVPFEAQPAGWTLVGRGDIQVSSSGGIVQVPVDLDLFLDAGDTAGIAVYSPTFGSVLRTENPPAGTTSFSDGKIVLASRENILHAEQVGLGGTVSSFTYYARRDAVNVLGTVWYDAGSTPRTTPPAITTLALPQGTEAAVYAATLRATGGTAPYRWQVTGLPAGLVLDAASGLVSGIPNAAGSSNLSVTVTDAAAASATRPFTLTVAPAPAPATGLVITTPPTLPDAVSGWVYTEFLAASGGGATLTWSAATPLPGWLALEASTGRLRGNPATAHEGTTVFTIRVTDGAATAAKVLALTVKAPVGGASPLSVSTLLLNEGTSGRPYSATLAATGGAPPYGWSVLGLPAGLAVNAATGEVSGVPTSAGRSTLNVTVTDAARATAIRAFTLTILPGSSVPLVLTTASPLPDATVGAIYSQTLAASGGSGTYQWSASGLPAWLGLGAGGVLSGTPGLADVGTRAFSVTVTDGVASAGATLSVTIVPAAGGPPLAIGTAALPNATVGVAYAFTLAATGGTPSYAWSLTAGTILPAGLGLDPATGTIRGTPTADGTSALSVRVTDATAAQADRALSLAVFPGASAVPGGKLTVRNSGSGGCAFHPGDGPGGAGLETLAPLVACLLAALRARGARSAIAAIAPSARPRRQARGSQ